MRSYPSFIDHRMLKYFRVKQQPEQVVPDLGAISLSLLEQDGTLPFTIRQLNNLPQNVKQLDVSRTDPPCPADALRHRSHPMDGCQQRRKSLPYSRRE
jgi:hypothetical protein